jgi:hypothetical protein
MKILFICKGEYRYFFPAIARALKDIFGCEVVAVCFGSPAARMLEKQQSFGEVHNLAAYLKQEVSRLDLAECCDLLGDYELTSQCDNLNTMVHADRILKGYPFERILRILAAVVRFWKDVLQEWRPDVVIGEVACATEWLAWAQANRLGVPYLIPYPTPFANRFFFIQEPAGRWERMERQFDEVSRRELTSKETQIAENFVQEFRARKPKPSFLDWSLRSPLSPDIRRLSKKIARIPYRIQSWTEDGQFEIASYHGTPPWEPVWQEILRVCRHVFSEATMLRKAAETRPIVYFPLHVQPEFTTDVRAPFSANQIALIENISRSLPIEYRIVVKEHPGMKGWRALSDYRELKKLHNLQLVSPSVDGHDLIQQSDAVLTITGSSAWEAILYEKPVIAFGPLCYGFFNLIYHCTNIAELPAVLSEALRHYRPNHELLLKFVHSFLTSAYELEWADPIRSPQILERQNVERIASAILTEVTSLAPIRQAEPVFIQSWIS